jgi:pimeloyl-ACP methyl ester carboxylesterase
MLATGNDYRPTLALLAGLLCDEEIWREVAASLNTTVDVRIFSFPMFSSIEMMAGHVAAVIEGPFAIAGHSMGGRVALEVVRRFPQRVTGVALLNTGIHPPAPQEPATRGRLVALAREKGMAALAREWLPPMMGRSTDDRGELMARLTAMVERQTAESFAQQIKALLSRPSAREVLPDIRVPVVLLSATDDSWSPPKQHEEMRQLCPGAELVVIERAGHMSPVEQPVAVAAVLDAWLLRVSQRERHEGESVDMKGTI